MRPIKLIMKAFGPYKSIEVVDFSELKQKNLFLITGPTGAGKTTLFDAISFAIYGEASGNLRLAESLRSHFADNEQLTEVELDFELKGVRYHIHRIPRQLKPKSKGEGLTEQKAEAVLTLYDGISNTVIAGVKPVNEYIERILGINAEQFKQIMMIPQGEFQKLLTATTEEREQVLQKLFDTSLYGSVQTHLESQAKQLFNEIKLNNELRERQIQRIMTEEEELVVLLTKEDKNIAAIIEGVRNQLKADDLRLQSLDQEQQELIQASEAIVSRREQCREINDKLTAKAILESQINALNDKQPIIEGFKSKATQAELAFQVEPLAQHYVARLRELKEKQEVLDQKNKAMFDAKAQLTLAEATYQREASEERLTERDKLYTEVVELRSYSEKVSAIAAQVRNIQTLETEKEALVFRLQANVEAKSNQLHAIETLQKKCDSAKEAEIQASQLRESLHQKREIYKLLQGIDAYSSQLKDLNLLIEAQRTKIDALGIAKEKAQHDLITSKKIHAANQAAAMAAGLLEGSPCPVCGSAHHPTLAEYAGTPVTENELTVLEEALHQVSEQYQSARTELKLRELEWDQTQKSYDTGIISIHALSIDFNTDVPLSQWIQAQLSEIDALEQSISQLSSMALTYGALRDALDKADQDLKQIELQSSGVNESILEVTATLSGANALLSQTYQEIPESLQSEQQLKDALLEKELQYRSVTAAYEEARQKRENYQRAYETAKSLQEQLTLDVVSANNHASSAKESLQFKMAEMGFENEEAYKSALLPSAELTALKSEVDAYYQSYHALSGQLVELHRVTKGLSPVDLSEFETDLLALRQRSEACFNERSQILNRIQVNRDSLTAILEINALSESKENAYRLIGHLSKVTKGDNKLGITFERYVLAAFLKDVLVAANIRLNQMTAGRYKLDITEERLRSNAKGGLDLEVYDHYTGRARHVRTLSGGEGFKASLAMALGLADTVQSYSGGVSLDTLFVDEGFGTLDQESLDSAITCLIDLQKSGRLVGIISHVQELKERIDTRLEVIATREGSRTHFVVG